MSRRLCHSSERWRRADHRSLRCCTSFRMLRFIFEDTWSLFPFFSLSSSPSISPPRETIQVNHISKISHHISKLFYCTKVLNVCISSPERNPLWVVLSSELQIITQFSKFCSLWELSIFSIIFKLSMAL